MAYFSDSAKGMSEADVRGLMNSLINPRRVFNYTGVNVSDVPTSVLRDALYGAQNYSSPGFLTSRKSYAEPALIERLRAGAPLMPGRYFSPTGVDRYRLWNPDEIVAPNAKSYNDEWGPYID